MRYIIFFILFFSFKLAFAADPAPDISIINTVNEAIKLASTSIMPLALQWLGGFMALQFVITNYTLLKSDGDMAAMFAKLLGILLWFMFCIYVIQNGADFIDSVGNGILTTFASDLPSPGSVITATLSICSSILIGIAATGTSIAGIGNSSVAMVLVYILLFIFAVGSFMAIKLIMLQIELGLMVMMAPLSFSFLGLNALRDQGIAPFKSLISLIYRIVLLGVVFTAFSKVIETTGVQLDAYSWKNPLDWGSKIQLIFAMLFAYPICVYLVWKSDSIASSLASGSTNMGTGDVASSAAAGGAVGGAIGSAASSVATGGKSMSDVFKSMGSAGAVSNASPTGAGGFGQKPVGTPPAPPPKAPEMSKAQVNADRMAMSPGNGGNPPPASSSSGPAGFDGKAAPKGMHYTNTEPASTKAVGEAPSKAATAGAAGSGSSAGIGGASSATDQKLDKLMETMGQSNKPSFKDRLAAANDHIAKEQAATHVSISTNNSD